ncbi:MAG: hypothetical protein ABFR53_03275, partial [Actinomycetota bacterium]
SGHGDDVVSLSIPDEPVVIEFSHDGDSNFYVWSLDTGLNTIDLLVNEIGTYSGTRLMQAAESEVVKGLEIGADGNWTYEIRRLSLEPNRSCPVVGTGDSVMLLPRFEAAAGTATITHDGGSNFYIWAWSGTDRDLLVNEIGVYSGTVLVSEGYSTWEIGADGMWTIDC